MPTQAKSTPSDHKTPTEERYFTFTHNGTDYTLPKPISTITKPGFMRKNRRRDEMDLGFTALEALAGAVMDAQGNINYTDKAGQECLDALDEMDEDEFEKVTEELWKFADMPQGE